MSGPAILELPASVTLALWLPTVTDRDSAFRAARAVARSGEHHEVHVRPRAAADPIPSPVARRRPDVTASAWLAALHELFTGLTPVIEVAALLPRAGDPMGAPAARSADLLDAGEGLLLRRADGAAEVCSVVVPVRSTYGSVFERGELVTWTVEQDITDLLPAPSLLLAGVDSISQARREIQLALTEAVEALEDLDVARDRPDLAEHLLDLSLATIPDRLLPPGLDPRQLDVLERAARLLAIVDLALDDDGGAVTAAQISQRAAALASVERAARHALCAASATRPARRL
ncbi:hypothetical protein [Georgenia thermotolerans]|uniref:Uncharacterized protein n=1 Tax=Georgenia thermotolerans TaxID=527326 RepID=A0A7J5UNV8_9MICO|nr:hypothetical protein [Georgenia thermotolerans]KAE8763794.1 hypothetical protein GB883_12285 [Georgenia thermotolerans]